MNHLDSSRIAGAATPSDPQAENSMGRNLGLCEGNMNDCSCTILDEHLDAVISIADLNGATFDDVVRLVGQVPEAIFAATVYALAALALPLGPTALPDLLHEHRALSQKISQAVKDSTITDAEIQRLDRKLEEIEVRIVMGPTRVAAMAYAELLTVFPEIVFDLTATANKRLRAEIEATIGGEV